MVFPHIKMKGKLIYLILCLFWENSTEDKHSVRTPGLKRQNQNTETPKSRKLVLGNGNKAPKMENSEIRNPVMSQTILTGAASCENPGSHHTRTS